MTTTVVVDTSGILALLDHDHPAHDRLAGLIRAETWDLVLTPLVVAEADYMVLTHLGVAAARSLSSDIAAGAYSLAPWAAADHAAATEVSAGVHDYIGITDAANVVLAGRHRTTLMLTLDQRHFRMLRPLTGGAAFTLLPDDWPVPEVT